MVDTYPFNLAESQAECVKTVGSKSAYYLLPEPTIMDMYYCSNDKPCAKLTDHVSIEKRIDSNSFGQLSEPG